MRTMSWKLLLASSASVAFAADATPASGYKGIPWDAPCAEAVRNMQAQGFVFDRADKIGLPAQARSPREPELFVRSAGRATCSGAESDLMLDTHLANPYVEIVAASGDITVTLLCRNQRFVGARLETRVDRTGAVAMLTKAAGAPVRTIRANTCDDGLSCTADHSLLPSRGNAVRYLERPVRSSRDYAASQDPPALRYLILARSEDRALQTASLVCAKKRLAAARVEEQRIRDGNRAALQ